MLKYNVTRDECSNITIQMLEIQRKILLKNGSPINPHLVKLALEDIIKGKFHHKADNVILSLISEGETIVIDPCDGSETLATAKEVFQSSVDGDFKKWGTNTPSIATKEQAVEVYKLVKDATFAQMFSSFGVDFDKLCLTQAQIKNFCKKHSNWLNKDRYATFFLFKGEDKFFIASVDVSVDVRSDGLSLGLVWFDDDDVISAEFSPCLVVPQLND